MNDKTTDNPPQVSNSNSSSGSGKFFIGLLALLALVISAAGIAGGYYGWQQLNRRIDQAAVDRQAISHEVSTIDENAKLQSFKTQLEKNMTQLGQQVEGLSVKLQQQADLQSELTASAEETLAYVNRSQLEWGLKEVEHVLRMANHRLHIEGDIQGSIAALNAADQRLFELNDPRLLPVRASVSEQIGKLKNFPHPDWAGISLQIDNVISGLKDKVIDDAKQQQQENTEEQTQTETQNEPESRWDIFVNNIKDTINNSVTVTREEQNLKVFISQQEKQQAYEFLRTKLLGAKYAVTSHDNESYHRELEAALAWLENTNSLKNPASLRPEIEALNSYDLEPELPNITDANTALQEVIENIENN